MLARASSRSFSGLCAMTCTRTMSPKSSVRASPNTSRLKRPSSASGRGRLPDDRSQESARPRPALPGRSGAPATSAARIADADLRDGAEREARTGSSASRRRRRARSRTCAAAAREPALRDHRLERAIGGLEQAPCHRDALLLGVSSRPRVGAAPAPPQRASGEIVGVLQPGVHALRAGRSCGCSAALAEQEAAPVAGSARRGDDGCDRSRTSHWQDEIGARLARDRRHTSSNVTCSRSILGRMPITRQRSCRASEEQVEAVAPQIDR